jgi:hypothetical protein
MGEIQDKTTIIYSDNKSSIAITRKLVHHIKIKLIAIKYPFIREAEATKQIQHEYCTTDDQMADIFTKALPRPRFELLRTMLGVTEICSKNEC